MNIDIDINAYKFNGKHKLVLAEQPNRIEPIYKDKKQYKKRLKEYRKEIDALQNTMYAHDRYGMLLLFQAMDAAGKDGTIRHVMSGINPHGVIVAAFKKPSNEELDHSFLWRSNRKMPARGKLQIFNRSYYEEVLVTRVHPEIITRFQKLPPELTNNLDTLWQQRYAAINDLEAYENNNGIKTIKFFLNLSKEEQQRRFIERIERPEKNWKFSEADIKERGFWDDYMQAYQQCINATASPDAPWYVIPADDKRTMRLIVSEIILQHLSALDMSYPSVDDARRKQLQSYKQQLLAE